jgi:hypothetical protein
MKDTASELQQIIHDFVPRLAAINSNSFREKPRADKWSKQEILGHLIDSAHNNARRFIVAQTDTLPPKIRYQQDFWVELSGYQKMTQEDVIHLWKLENERICSICANTPPSKYNSLADTGADSPDLHTIEWLASDYVQHLKHHLNQIIAGSFNVVYP